jgi:hypothetical protein
MSVVLLLAQQRRTARRHLKSALFQRIRSMRTLAVRDGYSQSSTDRSAVRQLGARMNEMIEQLRRERAPRMHVTNETEEPAPIGARAWTGEESHELETASPEASNAQG